MRSLHKEEYDLIVYMLNDRREFENFENHLRNSIVEEMNDGGMGSLRFLSVKNKTSVMKDEIASIDLYDSDGVPVFISINTNTDDEIFELDVFKGDFSPLKTFPLPPYR